MQELPSHDAVGTREAALRARTRAHGRAAVPLAGQEALHTWHEPLASECTYSRGSST